MVDPPPALELSRAPSMPLPRLLHRLPGRHVRLEVLRADLHDQLVVDAGGVQIRLSAQNLHLPKAPPAAVGTVQQERTACGGSGCGCPRDGEAQVCRKPSVGACLTTAVQPGARAQVQEALDGRAQVRPLEHVVPEHGGRAWVSQDVAVALQLLARRKAPVALWHGRRVRAVPTGGFGAAPCRRPRCGIGAAGCAGGGGRGGALAGAPGWSRCRGFR